MSKSFRWHRPTSIESTSSIHHVPIVWHPVHASVQPPDPCYPRRRPGQPPGAGAGDSHIFVGSIGCVSQAQPAGQNTHVRRGRRLCGLRVHRCGHLCDIAKPRNDASWRRQTTVRVHRPVDVVCQQRHPPRAWRLVQSVDWKTSLCPRPRRARQGGHLAGAAGPGRTPSLCERGLPGGRPTLAGRSLRRRRRRRRFPLLSGQELERSAPCMHGVVYHRACTANLQSGGWLSYVGRDRNANNGSGAQPRKLRNGYVVVETEEQ